MNPCRRIRPSTFLLVALSLSPFLASPASQDPTPVPASPGAKMTPAEKETKVRELLDVTDASKMGENAMEQMMEAFRGMPGLKEGFIEKFQELAKPEELVELVVPIYMKHVAEEDLQPVIDFFRSKVGARWIQQQKPILKESMEAGQTWGRDLAEKTMKALDEGK